MHETHPQMDLKQLHRRSRELLKLVAIAVDPNSAVMGKFLVKGVRVPTIYALMSLPESVNG